MTVPSDLRGMRVLVTGGAGFIGSHTVRALLARGAHVAVVDNLSTGLERNLDPRATLYKLNLADPHIADVMERERPNIIYHFAFFVLVPKSTENPLLDLDVLAGSLRMFDKARDIGVKKVIFSSSGFLYGNRAELPVAEEIPVDPMCPYVVSKHALENYLKFYHRAYRLPFVILRYSAVYGPGQVTGAMADYIRKLAAGHQAEMWGDGTKTRDYVYVDDVVRANLLALAVPPNHPNPVFNIGTGRETTLNALYEKIAAILNRTPQPIYLPDRAGEQIRYCLDIQKAKAELGWEPQCDLDYGLKETVAAYLAHKTEVTSDPLCTMRLSVS